MTVFNPGDRVRCIETGSGVTLGNDYIVASNRGKFVKVEGQPGGKYAHRFELIEETDMYDDKYVLIVSYDAQEKLTEQSFNNLLKEAASNRITDVDVWNAHMRTIETEYMAKQHYDKPDAKHTKAKAGAYDVGDWKYSKFLPAAYKSGKSVIGKALANGVVLLDESLNPKGKSQLERESKDTTPDSSRVTIETVERVAKQLCKTVEGFAGSHTWTADEGSRVHAALIEVIDQCGQWT